jgi:hypothetical protein
MLKAIVLILLLAAIGYLVGGCQNAARSVKYDGPESKQVATPVQSWSVQITRGVK